MDPDLPKAVAAYFDADAAGDAEAVAAAFTEDAVVTDERRTHRGRAAIAAWKAELARTLTYTTELLDAAQDGNAVVVRGRVSGSFPGSPVELRYRFTLAGGRISALAIAP